VIPSYALQRRRESTGGAGPREQRAATALGRLHLLEIINDDQLAAGEALAALWGAYALAAGLPPRWVCVDRERVGTAGDVSPERWRCLASRFDEVRGRVLAAERSGCLGWSLLDTIIADNLVPPRIERVDRNGAVWDAGRQVLWGALDAVGEFFKIGHSRAA